MNFRKLHRYLLGLFAIFFFILSCSKKDSRLETIQSIQANTKITDEESLYQIAKVVFLDTLKNFKSEKNTNGKQDVTIEYGSNRAYTFFSQGDYSEKIQFDVVRHILLYAQASEKRNLGNLRISLIKPFFVKEPEAQKEITEEFEVFRVTIHINDIKQIAGWNNNKIWNDAKNIDSATITELFNQVRLKWKIELNELSRIELK